MKKSTKPTSRSFNRLLNVKDDIEIANAIIACCWEADGNAGESPIIQSLVEWQNFTDADLSAQYVDSRAHVEEKYDWVDVMLKSDYERIFEMPYDDWLHSEMERMRQALHALAKMAEEQGISPEQLLENLRARMEAEREAYEQREPTPEQIENAEVFKKGNKKWFATKTYNAEQFHAIGLFFASSKKAPTKVPLEWIHQVWIRSRVHDKKIPHPLVPIGKAWLTEQIPKILPQRRKDTGILHHSLRDSAPSPRLKMRVEHIDAEPEQMMLITNLPQGELQLELPGFAFPASELVPALPLVAYENAGGQVQRKGRGAPIEQRLFFNILVEYEQKQRGIHDTSRLMTNYRDVKSWLYPNGTTEPRKTLIPKLYKGMYYLHNLRFAWDRREWNIISVDSMPTMNIKPDDDLLFTVRLPPGMNTQNGALIGIEPMRLYGAQSAPKFRAWVRLAYFWDAAKIRNGGKRIYATVPEVLRNSDDYLVDAKGQVILTGDLYHTKGGWKFRQGNMPQQAWYHPLAIQTGQPVKNPQAHKVPVLSDSDMVKLFYDHTERKGEAFRKTLLDARRNALEMHDDGRIVVETDQVNEKTGVKGWRILEPH